MGDEAVQTEGDVYIRTGEVLVQVHTDDAERARPLAEVAAGRV